MIEQMRARLPRLEHVIVVGDDVPAGYFDLRAFLEADDGREVSTDALRPRRPAADQLARTAFTSGTTGNPKAVLHTHNTTNCALRFPEPWSAYRRRQRAAGLSSRRPELGTVQRPAGNRGGVPRRSPGYLQAGRGTGAEPPASGSPIFCCAPAHLVAMLNSPEFGNHDLASLQVIMTGGASLSDRGYPGSADAHARTPARNVRDARVRHPGPYRARRQPGPRSAAPSAGRCRRWKSGWWTTTARTFRPAPSERS